MTTLVVSMALAFAIAFALAAGAYAQQAPAQSNAQCTPARADAPTKIEGTVTKVGDKLEANRSC